MTKLTRAVLALLFLSASCSETTAVQRPTTADIAGSWVRMRPANEPPGQLLQWTLSVANGTVTGTGQWGGEAAPFGPLSLVGTAVGDSVKFDIEFDYSPIFPTLKPYHGHFAGVLDTTDEMTGTLTRDGFSPETTVLTKIRIVAL
jgi:hypothetical protein